MATGSVDRNGVGVARSACGKFTGDGTALSVTLGYYPHHVVVFNMTDGTRWDWVDGMDANASFKAGTGTDTSGVITPMEKGFIVNAATNAAGKKLVWMVH